VFWKLLEMLLFRGRENTMELGWRKPYHDNPFATGGSHQFVMPTIWRSMQESTMSIRQGHIQIHEMRQRCSVILRG
jgi:hypothetical protein